MSQNSNANNNFLRFGGGRGNATRGAEVDNQLRPSASDATDPTNKYLTSVRIGTTEYWNSATGLIPKYGEIIIYTDYKTITKISPVSGEEITENVPGIKVGTGNGYVQDLAFLDDAVAAEIYAHITNSNIHITTEERTKWNNKVNVVDAVVNETLVFTRN